MTPSEQPAAAWRAQGDIQASAERQLAPIALFAYNRPLHTLRCLESLALNPGFSSSDLHIFLDGSRSQADLPDVDATWRVVQAWPHPRKRVHVAAANQGLAASVIAGVGRLVATYGQVIVVEDDLTVSSSFVAYMNQALRHYERDERVMQIAGHMYPVPIAPTHDAVFLPVASSWGWATWARAWERFDPSMSHYPTLQRHPELRAAFDLQRAYPYYEFLRRQHLGKSDSWFIRWYLSIFMHQGLVLYPRVSLVKNGGFDGTGVHCGAGGSPYDAIGALEAWSIAKLPEVSVDDATLSAVREFLAAKNTVWQRARRRIRSTPWLDRALRSMSTR